MNRITILMFFACSLLIAGCSSGPNVNVQSLPSLISEDFISNDTYEVVCRGYPREGLSGAQKEESAKRAALLNAYYFVQSRFDSTVLPDRDGTVVKYEVQEDFAVIYYRVHKKDIKKRLKK